MIKFLYLLVLLLKTSEQRNFQLFSLEGINTNIINFFPLSFCFRNEGFLFSSFS